MEIRLPERTKPGRDSFPTSRWGLRCWLREFAETRPRERLKRLDEALVDLHQQAIDPRRRVRALQCLLPAAREMLDELARRVGGQSLPLPDKTRATHEANVRLLERLARNFDAVVADECARAGKPSAQCVACAGHAALALRSELLLRCAQVYVSPPSAFWRSVHAVFAAVEAAGMAERPVRPLEGTRKRVHAGDEFKRIVLFAVARPQGLRRGDILPLYRALAGWVPQVPLLAATAGEAEPASGQILVDLERPIPPIFRSPDADTHSRSLRILPVAEVVEQLERLADNAPGDDAPITDPDRLRARSVRQVLTTFRQDAVRSHPRRAVEATAEVAVGLRAIHDRLIIAARPPPADGDAGATARPTVLASQLSLQTIDSDAPDPRATYLSYPADDRLGRAASAWDAVSRGRPATARADDEPPARRGNGAAAQEHWLVTDNSSTGLRLRRAANQRGGGARVGELLGVREQAGACDQPWRLAVVRWLEFDDAGGFELGAERLPGRARAAELRREPENPNRKRRREFETAEPALLVPGNRDQGRASRVILAAHMFRVGEIVELDIGGQFLRVRLAEAQESTNSFTFFTIQAAPRHTVRTPDTQPDEPPGIWDEQ